MQLKLPVEVSKPLSCVSPVKECCHFRSQSLTIALFEICSQVCFFNLQIGHFAIFYRWNHLPKRPLWLRSLFPSNAAMFVHLLIINRMLVYSSHDVVFKVTLVLICKEKFSGYFTVFLLLVQSEARFLGTYLLPQGRWFELYVRLTGVPTGPAIILGRIHFDLLQVIPIFRHNVVAAEWVLLLWDLA